MKESGIWAGRGAERLGLRDSVQRTQFVALLRSEDPTSGKRLTAYEYEPAGKRRNRKQQAESTGGVDRRSCAETVAFGDAASIAQTRGVAEQINRLGAFDAEHSLLGSREVDRPKIAKDYCALILIEHATEAQLSRCISKAASSSGYSGRVATTSDRINPTVRTNLVRIRCRICEVYGVTGVSHPMMMHVCDGAIACRREGEDVNANPSSEIAGSGAHSCEYELFSVFVREIYSPAFSEKISQDSSADLFTFVFVAVSKQARHHHEQSDATFTHILSPGSVSELVLLAVFIQYTHISISEF